MKLAETEDRPNEYAKKNNFEFIQFTVHDIIPIPNIIKTLGICIKQAKENGCIEFSHKEIRYHYSVTPDTHSWEVSIYGFRPKTDDKNLK